MYAACLHGLVSYSIRYRECPRVILIVYRHIQETQQQQQKSEVCSKTRIYQIRLLFYGAKLNRLYQQIWQTSRNFVFFDK